VDPILELDEQNLQVEPGAELRARVSVRNGGDEVERYRLEVLGDAARWAQVEPRLLVVPPGGTDRAVEVVFRPPHAAAAPTVEVPFGVRAHSVEHRDRAGVVEGDLRVSAVPDLTARIEPPAAAGRWGADFRVRFEHAGRDPLPLQLTATDGPRALRYAIAPTRLTIAPGAPAEVLVSVRTRSPKLVGAPTRHVFSVDHRADTGSCSGRLSAVFEQRAVLPTAVFAVLAVIAAAVVAGAALLVWQSRSGAGASPVAAPSIAAAPAVPTAAPTAAGEVVHGYLVLYGPPSPVDDTASSRTSQQLLARLRAAGVDARVVDSRDSARLEDGPRGLLLVLRDGFADRAAADAECAAHRDVAPGCVVVAPR
jgi:hypothetical protein